LQLFLIPNKKTLHLRRSSPCINAGSNYTFVGTIDLDGSPRIANGRVDMGVYEYKDDMDGDSIRDSWEVQHFGSITNCAPADNPDNDSMSNLQEYIAGTDPKNPSSYFRISEITFSTGSTRVAWSPAVSNRIYTVKYSGDITNSFSALNTSAIYYPQNSYTDTLHNAGTGWFYRVKVDVNE